MTASKFAYIHCRPDGTPFYVGKGALRRAKYFGERNQHHKNVVAKYGKENLLVGYLECSTDAQAYELESGLIKCLRRAGVTVCNLTAGGDGGRSPSLETRKRMSAAAKKRGVSLACRMAGANAKRGTPLSDEHKAKLRDVQTGKVFSAEHRANISAGAKKRGISDKVRAAARAACTGRAQASATVAKRKASNAASKHNHKNVIPVVVNGIHYICSADAARANNVSKATILNWVRVSRPVHGNTAEYAK